MPTRNPPELTPVDWIPTPAPAATQARLRKGHVEGRVVAVRTSTGVRMIAKQFPIQKPRASLMAGYKVQFYRPWSPSTKRSHKQLAIETFKQIQQLSAEIAPVLKAYAIHQKGPNKPPVGIAALANARTAQKKIRELRINQRHNAPREGLLTHIKTGIACSLYVSQIEHVNNKRFPRIEHKFLCMRTLKDLRAGIKRKRSDNKSRPMSEWECAGTTYLRSNDIHLRHGDTRVGGASGFNRNLLWRDNSHGGFHVKEGFFLARQHTLRLESLNLPKSPPRESDQPNFDKQFLGIEIEHFQSCNTESIRESFLNERLHKHVCIGTDGSIRPPRGQYGAETRILCREDELEDVVVRTCRALAENSANVNRSCGMHVHIDCRHREPQLLWQRLRNAQDLLFNLVSVFRRKNGYAARVENGTDFYHAQGAERYSAINADAYRKHRTIEVRLHGGTTNAQKIIHWTKLLIAIADAELPHGLPPTLAEIAQVLSLTPATAAFLEMRLRHFNRGDSVPFCPGVEPAHAMDIEEDEIGVSKIPDLAKPLFLTDGTVVTALGHSMSCGCDRCKAERQRVYAQLDGAWFHRPDGAIYSAQVLRG
jgi:hypothetical protein